MIVGSGDPQCVANIAWANAKVGEGGKGFRMVNFYKEVNRRAEWFVGTAKPQGISQVAVACCKAGMEGGRLFEEIDER